MHDQTDRNSSLGGKAAPPQLAEPTQLEPASAVALEARSETKEAEIIVLNERLAQVHGQTEELAVREQELTGKLAAAVEKTKELHTKIVAATNDLGGES